MWSGHLFTLKFLKHFSVCNRLLKLHRGEYSDLYGWKNPFYACALKCSSYLQVVKSGGLGLPEIMSTNWIFFHYIWVKLTSGFYTAQNVKSTVLWDAHHWQDKWVKREYNFNQFKLMVGVLDRCASGSCGGNLQCKSRCLDFSLNYRGQCYVHCTGL